MTPWVPTREDVRVAHVTFAGAMRAGMLRSPNVCSECGREGTVCGHHPDYSRPLYVVWLCSSCHGRAHKGMPRVKGPEHAPDPDVYLTPQEVAGMLNLTAADVRAMCRAGTMPHMRITKAKYLFSRSEMDAWVESERAA